MAVFVQPFSFFSRKKINFLPLSIPYLVGFSVRTPEVLAIPSKQFLPHSGEKISGFRLAYGGF